MSHDLISDSIFHLNNDNAAFQVHMIDAFRGSLEPDQLPFLTTFFFPKEEYIWTWEFSKTFC